MPESPHLRGLRLKGALEDRARRLETVVDDMRTMISLKADDTPLYISQTTQRQLRWTLERVGELLALVEEKEAANG